MLTPPPPPGEQNLKSNLSEIYNYFFFLYSAVYKIQALLVFVYDASSYYNEMWLTTLFWKKPVKWVK